MPPSPIAIVTADTHLRDKTWVDRRGLTGDAYFSFRQLVDAAIDQHLPIIAAGDLIDRRRNEADVVEFLRVEMSRLNSATCRFYYVQGQHELQYPVPWLSAIHPHPTWLDVEHAPGQTFKGGVRLTGLDWRPAEHLRGALERIPTGTDVLVLHQVCQEFMGGVTAAEMNFEMVPHARVVVVGDYHVHEHKRAVGAQGQPLLAVSPGSTSLQNVGEVPEKFYYVMCDDLSFRSKPLRTRVFFRTDVLETAEQLERFVVAVPELLENLADMAAVRKLPDPLRIPIVEIQYDPELPDAYRRLVGAVGDGAHLFLREIVPGPADEVTPDKTARREAVEQGLVGCLPLVIDPEEQPEVYAACVRLLRAPDPQQELLLLRAEHGL